MTTSVVEKNKNKEHPSSSDTLTDLFPSMPTTVSNHHAYHSDQSPTTEKTKELRVKWQPKKTPNSSKQPRHVNTPGYKIFEQNDLPHLFDSTYHTDGEKNQYYISVHKDPGINSEVLNVFPTEKNSVVSAT